MADRSPKETVGLLSRGWLQLRLAWRLFRDGRVPLWSKILIPAAALAYVIFPMDFLPDLIPVLGEMDDLALALLGLQAFISLSPKNLVEEHLRRLRTGAGATPPDGDVIDGEFKVHSG